MADTQRCRSSHHSRTFGDPGAFGASSLVLFSLVLAVNQVAIKLSNDGFQPVFSAGLRLVSRVNGLSSAPTLAPKPLPGPPLPRPAVEVDGRVIWGLTYRVLVRFSAQVLGQRSPLVADAGDRGQARR